MALTVDSGSCVDKSAMCVPNCIIMAQCPLKVFPLFSRCEGCGAVDKVDLGMLTTRPTCPCRRAHLHAEPLQDNWQWWAVSPVQALYRLAAPVTFEVGFAGRVAEEMIFGKQDVTTGASSDLEQVHSAPLHRQAVAHSLGRQIPDSLYCRQ